MAAIVKVVSPLLRQMRITVLPVLAALLLACGYSAGTIATPELAPPVAATGTPSSQSSLPNFSHIFVIVMENEEYGSVIGNPRAPYINQLAASYGLATHYYAVGHPSVPNYLALIAGSTLGVTSDCTGCLQSAPNLADQLDAHGRSWKAYMEDLPRPCFLGSASGNYALKHDPWLYFRDIRDAPGRCSRVVPLTQFRTDLTRGALPDFSWITPNLCHDMHDCSLQTGDAWLASFLPSVLASSEWKDNGVIFVVWDEGTSNAACCAAGGGGLVPLLVIGPSVPAGSRSAAPLDHYSVLRTIEDAWSLGELGQAASPNTRTLAGLFARP